MKTRIRTLITTLIALSTVSALASSFAMASELTCNGQTSARGIVKEYSLRVASNVKSFSFQTAVAPLKSSHPGDGRYQLYTGALIPNIGSGSFRMAATAGVNYYPNFGPLEFPNDSQIFVGNVKLQSSEALITLTDGTQVKLGCAPAGL